MCMCFSVFPSEKTSVDQYEFLYLSKLVILDSSGLVKNKQTNKQKNSNVVNYFYNIKH